MFYSPSEKCIKTAVYSVHCILVSIYIQCIVNFRHFIAQCAELGKNWFFYAAEAVRHEREISNAGRKKTGFCRKRSKQTGSSETLIGLKIE